MPAKAKHTIPSEKLELYSKLIATIPGIELKGATMPYTSHNGHMFSFLDKDGNLGIRLPEEEREAFIKKYKTSLFQAHGTVLKEYVTVPEALLKKTSELKKHFKASLEYVRALKPKPAKK